MMTSNFNYEGITYTFRLFPYYIQVEYASFILAFNINCNQIWWNSTFQSWALPPAVKVFGDKLLKNQAFA